MVKDLKTVNNDLDILTDALIKQLQTVGIEQTDLNYFIMVKNNLLMLKSNLELKTVLND